MSASKDLSSKLFQLVGNFHSYPLGNLLLFDNDSIPINYTLKRYIDITTDTIIIKKAITLDGYEFMIVDFKFYCTLPMVMMNTPLINVRKLSYETV